MKSLNLTLALCLFAAQGPAETGKKVIVKLADGSTLMVAAPEDSFILKTAYGDQRVRFDQIRSLTRSGPGEYLILTERSSLTGEPEAKDVEFRSGVGRFKASLQDVVALVGASESGLPFPDAGTVALWSFSDGRSRMPLEVVRERRVKLHEMDITADSDGTFSAARKGRLGRVETAADDDLEVRTGNLTIEARLKAGPVGNHCAVISKVLNKQATASTDFSLTLGRHGAFLIQSYSGRPREAAHHFWTPANVVNPLEWNYVAVVVQANPPSLTFYVNGKEVCRAAHEIPIFSSGAPIVLGPDAVNTYNNDAPERIQFVRLSNVARRPEEIRAVQHLFAPVADGVAAGAGVRLRDGSFLQPVAPVLEGKKFLTAYGELKIPENSGARVTLSPLRESDRERLGREVRELIAQLGADAGEKREEAQLKLVKMGGLAAPLLKAHGEDRDPEIARRIREILAQVAKAEVPDQDILEIGGTRVRGWLQGQTLEIRTRHGSFQADLLKVESVALQGTVRKGAFVARLRSDDRLLFDFKKGATLALENEFGPLTIPLDECVSLMVDASTRRCTLRTARISSQGKPGTAELHLETSAGPLTIPLDSLIDVRRGE